MSTTNNAARTPLFYTVAEAADLLRVDSATVYRAIRERAFPAVQVRGRYVVPAAAITDLIQRAIETGSPVNVAELTADRLTERAYRRMGGA